MKKLILAVLMISISISTAKSQSIEDALRFTNHNAMITARAGALDISYHGIVDDAAALYYNPAGLSLLTLRELSLGVGMQIMDTKTSFLGNVNDMSTTKGLINNFIFVTPLKWGDHNAAFSFGYNNEKNFDSNHDMMGFNPNGSYISYLDDLFMAKDSLQQEIYQAEDGSMNNITAGLAVDLNENFSVGVSFGFKVGSYEYLRNLYEEDVMNLYTVYEPGVSVDLHSFEVEDRLLQDFTGIYGSLGFLGRIGNFMRIGVNVKFPSMIQIEEKYDIYYLETYDNPDEDGYTQYEETEFYDNTYDVITPFVFSGGISTNFAGLTISAGIEYSDASSLEFDDAHSSVIALNSVILKEFTSTLSYGFGLEYEVPKLPVVVRGSYAHKSSPYVFDNHLETTNMSFGAGVYFGKKVRLDFGARLSEFSETNVNYGESSDPFYYSTFTKDSSPMIFVMGLTYRY